MFLTVSASKARWFSEQQVYCNYDSMNLAIVNIAMNCIHFLILVKKSCKYEVIIFPFTYPSLSSHPALSSLPCPFNPTLSPHPLNIHPRPSLTSNFPTIPWSSFGATTCIRNRIEPRDEDRDRFRFYGILLVTSNPQRWIRESVE